MKTYAYILNADQYVYTIDGEPQTALADTIAICFDKEDGTLHKHGTPEKVSAFSASTAAKLRNAGMHDWADNLVIVEGRFPLEELNKCLDITGYCKEFFRKLQCNEIEGLTYGPDVQEGSLLADSKPAP